MASLFGLPVNRLTNLTLDGSAQVSAVKSGIELPLMVGGRYDEKHRNIFILFGYNVSDTAEHQLVSQPLIELLALCPVLIIFVCQIGFALVQSGASRADNAAMPFVVNLLNFAIACVSYWGVGYAVGRSSGLSVLGYNHWFGNDFPPRFALDWVLHLTLTLTSTNIASFGGLERCQLWIYSLVALSMSGLVQSLAIHWAWYSDGWMLTTTFSERAKYHDFGGSGVIYITGGSAALVLTYVLGPRYGRQRRHDSRVMFSDIAGHSVPMEVMGGYLLFTCYICANCVRALTTCIDCDPVADVGGAVMNTVVAAAASGLTTLAIIAILNKLLGDRRFQWILTRTIMGGMLCGTVAVAAGCNVYQSWAACVVGITAAGGYVIWAVALYVTGADDPTGAVAVHLGGGIWGVVCVRLFQYDTGLLFSSNTSAAGLALLWNVVAGVTLGVVSGTVTGAVLMIPKMLNSIPLDPTQEIQGLDFAHIKQHAYRMNNDTPFSADIIEDREQYGDSSIAASPACAASPTSYTLSGMENEYPDGQYVSYEPDVTLPMQEESKWAPSYILPPSDQADKRVWFVNDFEDPMAPLSPMAPLVNIEREPANWDDVIMF